MTNRTSSPRVLPHPRILAIVASLFALSALALAAAAPASASASPWSSGAYVGPGKATALSQFATWRGTSTPVVVDYLGNSLWTDVSQPDWLLQRWQPFTASGGKLVLSVPLLVTQGGTLAQGAAGNFNGYFRTLAQRLVAFGDGSATIRLGWEFNGTWFPWSVTTSVSSNAAAFVAYWRQVVSTMRSVAGSHFTFDWSVNLGSSALPAEAAWPGSAYVDYVGIDAYDQGWAADGGPITDPAVRWQQLVSGYHGLNWWAAFAASHGKPVTVPEWGLMTLASGNGGGDDPLYISNMRAWFTAHHPAYECYFNADSSVITGGAYPKAAAAYVRLWGHTGTAPSVRSRRASAPAHARRRLLAT